MLSLFGEKLEEAIPESYYTEKKSTLSDDYLLCQFASTAMDSLIKIGHGELTKTYIVEESVSYAERLLQELHKRKS